MKIKPIGFLLQPLKLLKWSPKEMLTMKGLRLKLTLISEILNLRNAHLYLNTQPFL